MALSDPIAAYNAESNIDARLAQQFLEVAGIECYVTEDNPIVTVGWLGPLPELHKPQVWVERADTERVAQLLTEYEEIRRQRIARSRAESTGPIPVRCEQCGQESEFAAGLQGTIQDCRHCGAAVDVGEIDWPYEDDWRSGGEEDETPE